MKNNRRNSLLSLCLIILMTVNSAGTVFAQPVQNDQPEVSADNMQIEADGTDSAGEMIASVITEKQEQTGAQQQSDSYVTDLGLQGTTATVEYGTNKKADIVVAIYEEGKTQMIASGKTSIEAGSGTATVNISTGTMPQYFVASAFLLDADTHKALCQEYTTELYTKGIQDIKNSTPDDFEDKEVLRLNGEADDDNFAVYNDRTLTAEATDPNNKIQDNGNGTYTIKNADADFRSLKKGDTFSYEYADGTVLLVKVADVSISGTTVTVKEDSNTDLTDYFDYLKIEADDSNANYTVDNSKLEDGITPLTSEQSLDDTEAVGATNGGGTFRHNVSYYIEKNFEDSGSENFCKVKADVHFFFSFNVNFYLSTSYKYVSVKLDYELGISGSFAFGTESARDFAIGEISAFVIPCVKVAFTPSVVLSAKTEILWTGKITGTIGCCWDENFGFKNLCTSPKTQNDLKQRGNFFIGIKIKPAVQLIDSRVAEVSVNGSAGLEIRTEKLLDTSDTGKSSLHECGYGSCYAGTVYIKLAAEASAKLVKGWLGGSVTLAQLDIKFGDFYYSETYDEFNFTTCPHISYKVSLSVADTKMNKVKDATVYVLDKKTGSLVQMRLPGEEGKKVTKVDGVKTDDSGQCTFYLPTGDYLLKVKNGDLSCDKAFSVGVTKTELRIEDFPVKQTEPGKDGNITWKIDVDGTLYLNGSGAMQDFTEEDDDNAILPPWNDKDKEIYSVEIGDGITSIGNHAFDGCVNLSEVNMPDTVTLIGDSAFKECWNLEELTLSENLKKIRANAFTQCNMDILEIPASVTEIEDMAFAYTGLRWMYFKGNRPSFTEKAFCYTTISAYYPTGNTSWSGIQNMKSSTYNYDVTWNPYDPSIDIEEPESDEIEVAGSGIAEEEEAGEVIFEDGKNEEQNEEENPEISVDSDSKDTQKEEQEETSVTEESQDTEDISDGIVTVEDKPVFNELIQPSEDVKMSQASMATGMQPGTWCVFVAVKNKNAEDILNAENLLYINQTTVNASGEAYFTYRLKDDSQKSEECFFGEKAAPVTKPTATPAPVHTHKFTSWKTVREATVFAGELKERTCTSCRKKEQQTGNKLKPVLQVNAGTVTLKIKQNTTGLKVTKMAKGDSVVSWKSGNTKILKVSGKANGTCKLTAGKKTGKTTLTIKLKSGTEKKITVKVQKKPVQTKKITGLTKTMTLKKGKQVSLKPEKEPFTSQQKITYTSSNQKIVSVTSKGKVKAKKPGKAKITVRSGKKKYVITVTVKK